MEYARIPKWLRKRVEFTYSFSEATYYGIRIVGCWAWPSATHDDTGGPSAKEDKQRTNEMRKTRAVTCCVHYCERVQVRHQRSMNHQP